MQPKHIIEVALPIATFAVFVSISVLLGLKLLQRSLAATRLSPHGFPLARKLFPASLALIVALAVRSFVAALDLGVRPLVSVPVSMVVVWAAVYLVIRAIWVLTQLVLRRFEIQADDNLRSRRVRTQLHFLEQMSYVAIVFLGACATLLLFDGARNFGQSLLASAGVAGIIIGVAAQKSLSNFVAGFQIAFTQPLRIEDVVVVEGEWGWVEEITLTYVVVRCWDRRRLILPITYFVEKPFQNWTRTTSQIIGTVLLEVSHQVPFAALEAELFQLLDATPLWDRDVRVLQMVDAGTRSVTLRALMTAKNSPTCWDLRCYVRKGLIEFLRANYPEALPVVRLEHAERSAGRRDVSSPSMLLPRA